jgi:ABC-2 type transport system permease protein
MRLFLGTLFIVDGINMMMISTNFWRFPQYVTSGELDFYIIKPVSPFFMVFFRYINVASILNLITAVVFLLYGLHISAHEYSFGQIVVYIGAIMSGTVILLAMQTMMASLSLFLVNAEGIQHIFHSLYQFAMKPSSIYSRTMQRMFVSVFPMAMVASIPARVLYDSTIPSWLIVWQLFGAVVFITIAVRFFRWSLKFYTGASS